MRRQDDWIEKARKGLLREVLAAIDKTGTRDRFLTSAQHEVAKMGHLMEAREEGVFESEKNPLKEWKEDILAKIECFLRQKIR